MSKHGTVLKTGEAESRTSSVNGDVVALHHVTKHPKAGLVVMDWSFDFKDIDRKTLMELASRSLVIDQRGSWKKMSSQQALSDGETNRTFSVKEVLTKQKRGKSKAEKLADIAKSMDPAEVRATLERLANQEG